jgi:hypothetical protein
VTGVNLNTDFLPERGDPEELALARSTIQKMDRLFDDMDFKFLHSMMQENLDNKVRSLLSPPRGLDGVVDMLFLQGKISGFQEAMSFAILLKNGAESTVAQLSYLDEEGKEDGEREQEGKPSYGESGY